MCKINKYFYHLLPTLLHNISYTTIIPACSIITILITACSIITNPNHYMQYHTTSWLLQLDKEIERFADVNDLEKYVTGDVQGKDRDPDVTK